MSTIITNGYLIKVLDYRVFDQIVTFINKHGNKFVCFCAGTKKITSKNARSFIIGNYNQWEFFYTNDPAKMSRLVRSTTINQNRWPNLKSSFWLLQNLTDKMIYPHVDNFKFYQQMLFYVNNEQINDEIATLIVLANYIKTTGIDLYWKDCVYCHSHDISTISFQSHGLLCRNCQQNLQEKENYSLEFAQMLYYLFHDKYDLLNRYQKYISLAINRLKKYIHDNLGISLV